jgi:ATP-dependent protease Clp ATPase subunit
VGSKRQDLPLTHCALGDGGLHVGAHNLILVGNTGTGKTHFATALGWPPSIMANE